MSLQPGDHVTLRSAYRGRYVCPPERANLQVAVVECCFDFVRVKTRQDLQGHRYFFIHELRLVSEPEPKSKKLVHRPRGAVLRGRLPGWDAPLWKKLTFCEWQPCSKVFMPKRIGQAACSKKCASHQREHRHNLRPKRRGKYANLWARLAPLL